jgi:integrase
VLGVDYSEPNRLVRRRMFRGPRVKEGTQASGRPTPSPFASRPGRSARHRAYRLAVARAELPELAPHGPHDLRHTFATWLEDGGVPARVIDELMGLSAYTFICRSAYGFTCSPCRARSRVCPE